jgi:hypothetical protein
MPETATTGFSRLPTTRSFQDLLWAIFISKRSYTQPCELPNNKVCELYYKKKGKTIFIKGSGSL